MKIDSEKSFQKKSRLRLEAEARQSARNGRSVSQQLGILGQRMGGSIKEKARLIAKSDNPSPPVANDGSQEVVTGAIETAGAAEKTKRLSAKKVRSLSKKP